jgi:murein DD-endopeptidase MepM/ murein hydrolase activator NlpD
MILREPLKNPKISQEFGKDFLYWKDGKQVWFYKDIYGLKGHPGQDYSCSIGTPLYSMNDGEVLYAGYDNVNGNLIQIWNKEEGFKTLYGHNSELKKKQGDKVKAGDLIALTGNTGDGTGPHSHIGLKLTDKLGNGLNNDNGYNGAIDPAPYIKLDYLGNNIKDEDMKLKKIKGQKDVYLVDDVRGVMIMVVDVETMNALGGKFEEVDSLAGYIPSGTLVWVNRTIN